MIRLTRLNDRPVVVNAEMLKFIEETPDTVITLRSDDKILVKESADEVVQRAIEYARTIRTILPGA